MMKYLWILLIAVPVGAAELKDKKFDDSMTVDGKKLELNALGIRRASKYGITAKVYVGGFYVAKKADSLEGMLKMQRPMFFREVFLRNIDGSDLAEGWEKSFRDNCDTECEKAKPFLKEFTNLLTDVREDTVMTVKVNKDSIEVDNQGKPPKKGTIKSAEFATVFLKMFFGKNPADEKFQKELIGQAKE